MIWIYIILWFVCGYFTVRHIHQNHDKCPRLLSAFVAMAVWPGVVLLFWIMSLKIDWSNMVELIFGKGKE